MAGIAIIGAVAEGSSFAIDGIRGAFYMQRMSRRERLLRRMKRHENELKEMNTGTRPVRPDGAGDGASQPQPVA
jgi:hypothetical protein